MSKTINWGIIGLGNIANKFAADLLGSKNAKLYGVASRDIGKAKKFADTYKATKYYGSYQALSDDPEIDVVYIATPHSLHFANTMMCLIKSKAVLCEKPMGMNSEEVRTMVEEARTRKLFLMEAIWTRFLPATEKLLDLLEQKIIGDVLTIRADFGFKGDSNLEGRLYNKRLGGGALLDIGIYPIYLSLLALGIPTAIKAKARMTKTDVDSYCDMVFEYNNKAKANLEATFEKDTLTEAYIHGRQGHIKLHSPFYQSQKITISVDGSTKVLDLIYKGNGYLHEIEEVNDCLLNQKLESSKLPLNTSIDLMAVIDRVKQEIGLSYS